MVILDWLFEYWLPVKGYEGLYEVSNFGRVKGLKRTITLIDNGTETNRIKPETILKPHLPNNGYLLVTLYKNKKAKTASVHRLVAEAFLSNPNNYSQVNHRTEDKTNNCVWNLEWCNADFNCNYGNRNNKIADKIEKPIIAIDKNGCIQWYKSAKAASKELNIRRTTIVACLKKYKNHKTAGGFKWKYA